MNSELNIKKIKGLIASGYLKEAITDLGDFIDRKSQDSPSSEKFENLHKSIILQHSKYSSLKNGMINGNVEQTYIDREKSKISKSLLEMVATINKTTENNSLQLPQEISHEKLKHENHSIKEKKNSIQEANRTVELKIDDDFEQYSEKDKQLLLNAIKELLKMDNDIQIKKIRKGSIYISIDIPEDKYKKLLKAFKNGALDKYNVVQIDNKERKTLSKPKYGFKKRTENPRRGMNIFVARLNYDTNAKSLKSIFEEYGTVSSARIVHDKFTGRSKGFGFVEMDNENEAQQAIDHLNNANIDGSTITVKSIDSGSDGYGGNTGGSDFGGGNHGF